MANTRYVKRRWKAWKPRSRACSSPWKASRTMPRKSRENLKALKGNAENALKHSRHLISDAYEEAKSKPAKPVSPPATTPRNTLDHRRCRRWRTGSAGRLPAVQTR
jgi:hypothetical protein